MYCYYECSVALPHGDVGWSAVCDCGISGSYLLFRRNPGSSLGGVVFESIVDDARRTSN